ncbi:MAG: type II secretion system protein [Elusimicrobia bacterium]|nr:type II secretion system protein [Elusimicrobiota bacterium]
MIELILVSTIIGLLASIALPKFANLIDKSREAALKGSLGSLRSALEIYYADNEGIYPNFGTVGVTQLWGLWHLHDKYIDMDRINFVLPRYASNLCAGYPSSISATNLYSPTGTPGGLSSNTRGTTPDPPTFIIHMVGPYFSYFVWCPNALAPGTSAHLVTSGWCGGNLTDLSGRPWSHW